VSHIAPELKHLLQDWLAGVYVLPDDANIVEARLQLKAGELLVNQQGDIYSLYSVFFITS
jgi:chromosome segregation protein